MNSKKKNVQNVFHFALTANDIVKKTHYNPLDFVRYAFVLLDHISHHSWSVQTQSQFLMFNTFRSSHANSRNGVPISIARQKLLYEKECLDPVLMRDHPISDVSVSICIPKESLQYIM